ncbi:MAG: zinc-ribbon domain-containing protein [Oscillospiraceae bacterium]|jgi:hypothetical protein|nr:zinc-ribbon domain-containing protein [Oscillospiraceae bacterium]
MPSTQTLQRKFCPSCGHPVNLDARFCESCGNELKFAVPPGDAAEATQNTSAAMLEVPENFQSSATKAKTAEDYPEDLREMEVYMESGADYYLHRFMSMRKRHSVISWNWAAFLIPVAWFAYRKLFGFSILIAFSSIAFSFIPYALPFSLMIYIIAGMLGNYAYMNSLRRHQENTAGMDDEHKLSYIKTHKGTADIAAFMIYAGFLFLIFVEAAIVYSFW